MGYSENYYQEHREEIIARARKWQIDNPDRYKETIAKIWEKNGEKHKKKQAEWKKKNREKWNEYQRNYKRNRKKKKEENEELSILPKGTN